MQDCEKYLQEKGKAMSLTFTIDFLDENVLKHAVSIAMKETINLLAENNLLQVDDCSGCRFTETAWSLRCPREISLSCASRMTQNPKRLS